MEPTRLWLALYRLGRLLVRLLRKQSYSTLGIGSAVLLLLNLVFRHAAEGDVFNLEKSCLAAVTVALLATATAALLVTAITVLLVTTGTLDVIVSVNIS
jgi:hypothetical protein